MNNRSERVRESGKESGGENVGVHKGWEMGRKGNRYKEGVKEDRVR